MSVEAPSRHQHQLEDEFTGEHHVYQPHKVGLPPLGSYARELWRRREFAVEMSRTQLRAQHFNTAFGQLWLVLNPLLLAGVYFVLVDILRSGSRPAGFFPHLLAGIFVYYFVQQSLRDGVKSVTSGGKLILNTAFPRALLPLSSVLSAFMRFLPTFAIYVPVHLIAGRPVRLVDLWVVPIFGIFVLVAGGLTMLLSAAQVYFRDLSSFLPYLLRVWLYATPVLYFAHEVPDRYQPIIDVNPIGPTMVAWSDVLIKGHAPAASDLGLGLLWGVVLFLAGALFFVSREREFAVRL